MPLLQQRSSKFLRVLRLSLATAQTMSPQLVHANKCVSGFKSKDISGQSIARSLKKSLCQPCRTRTHCHMEKKPLPYPCCYNYGAETGMILFTNLIYLLALGVPFKKKIVFNSTKTMIPPQPKPVAFKDRIIVFITSVQTTVNSTSAVC